MKVILISGKAEAGKDTVAAILKKAFADLDAVSIPPVKEHISVRLAYGDYVKDTAREIWDWDGQKNEKGRALLQWWGTEYVRTKSPSFWVDTVIRLARIIYDDVDYLLVTDVRFPNEIKEWVNTLFEEDLITVRVERPGHVSALTAEQLVHISETALDGWQFDVVLTATDMDGLIAEVHEKLLPILKEAK